MGVLGTALVFIKPKALAIATGYFQKIIG
jgi:hypothetical protein